LNYYYFDTFDEINSIKDNIINYLMQNDNNYQWQQLDSYNYLFVFGNHILRCNIDTDDPVVGFGCYFATK